MSRDSKSVSIRLATLFGLYLAFISVIVLANQPNTLYSTFNIQARGLQVTPDFWNLGIIFQGESYNGNFTLYNPAFISRTLNMTSDLPNVIGILTWDREGFLLAGKTSVNFTLVFSVDVNAPLVNGTVIISINGT